MAEDYNLSTQEPDIQQDVGPDIRVQDPNPPLSPQLASKRADMADFGLRSKVNYSYDQYYSSFIQGQEKNVRNYVVGELDKLNAQRKVQKIADLANAGWPLTEEDVSNLESAYNDPKSVIEDHYAQRYMSHLNWPKDNPNTSHWLNNIHPEEADTINTLWDGNINIGTDYLARVKFFQTMFEDSVENAEKQSWTGWGIDQLKNLFTLYPWVKMHVSGTSWFNLPGSAQEEARSQFMSIPYEDMKSKYMSIYNTLKADNPGLAREFAQNMLGMTSDDRTLQNVLPIIVPGVEVSTVAGLAKSIFYRNSVRSAVRQQISSASVQAGLPTNQVAALAAGNVGSSAAQRVWGALINSVRRSDPIREAEEGLVGLLRTERQKLFINDGGDVNGTNMLAEEMDRMISQVPSLVRSLVLPERFPALTLNERNQEVLVAAAQAVRDRARDVSDRFWTVEEPYQDPISRNWWANGIIGKTPLDPFGSQGEAGRFAAKVNLNGQRYEQRGSGWVIVKPYLIPEDAPAMRPFYSRLPTEQVPEGGVINSMLARFRTPNETQSEWANRNRESATFSASVLERYAWDQAEAIRKMQPLIPFTRGSEKWNDWERVLNDARKRYDDQGRIGATYRNIGELNYAYMRLVGHLPDEQEVAAYFSFVRINDFDHVLRTISIMKHKQRLSTLSHKITYTNPKLPGDVRESPEFDAFAVDHFPGGDHGLAIVDETGNIKARRSDSLGMRQRTAAFTQSYKDFYKDAVEKGTYKVVKLYAPDHYPLAGFGGLRSDDFIEYVLVPSKMLSNKPLDWAEQLPKRGGGHFVHKNPFHVSQLDIREETIGSRKRQVLVGKNTGWTFATRRDAEHVSDLMSQVKTLLNKMTAPNIAAARDIVENKLGMVSPGADWQTVLSWFKSPPVRSVTGQWSRGNKPRFNLTEPFRVHMANENLANKVGEDELKARYPNFLDGRSRSPSQQFMTEFSQERDANEVFTFNNIGTSDNPMYRYEPSTLVDAIPTMNRALNKISNSLAMDDMKIQSVLSWMNEAKPFLNVPDSQLAASPLYWFHHGDFLKDPGNARRINELEVARQQIKNFIGQVSQTEAVMHYWAQKLSDTIYTSKYFSKFANKIDPVWLAHTLTDPTRFFRSMTFHFKMGLFAIPQILVQGQTYINILGIAGPVRATQGTAGALLQQMSRVNPSPSILTAMGRHAEKFGYRPGEWEAIREAGQSTGFFNVGREYAMIDDPMSNKIVKTRFGQFLDMGAWPFTEGERNVRYGSWYTAAKEYAETKPVSQWTNADKLAVLDRASLLNGNMNRASNAMYQKGFAALPAQFLTYTIRQAELFWGHRLTNVEKARLLLTNMVAYGIPVGIGITGAPSDYFKNKAMEHGYNVSDNYVTSLLEGGIFDTALALIDHDRHWNVGERFGNTGLNDFLYGDKTIWELASGAAGQTATNFFGSFLEPFRQWILSALREDGNAFTPTYEHLMQPWREITSFNSAERAVIASLQGKWISKTGSTLLKGISVPEALMSFITGLQPQEVADLRHIRDISTAEKSVSQWAEQHAIQEAGRGLEAADNNDPDGAKSFLSNAMMYLNVYIPDNRKDEVLTRMFEHQGDVISRVQQIFGTKDIPPGLEEIRRQQWLRSLK